MIEAGIIRLQQKEKRTKKKPRLIVVVSDIQKGEIIQLSQHELPRAFRIAHAAAGSGLVCHDDRRAVLLHDSDDLDPAVAFFLRRAGGRAGSDLSAHHVFRVDHRAVKDFDGLGVVVPRAAEEVHADAVAFLGHGLPLLGRRGVVAACRVVAAADGDDAAVGTGSAAGRGEYAREDAREARFERWQAGADDADVDFEVAP